AHTHDIPTTDSRIIPVDTGFIVHNERTYPNLLRLFGELGVATQGTEMSMSIKCEGCGLEYAGARGLNGVFAQRKRLADPKFVRMLLEVKRFHRHAHRLLAADPATVDSITLGAFLAIGGYSDYFVRHFMIPVVSCVWSAGTELSMQYPARYLFTFLDNHGMLTVKNSPNWRTVVGGSRAYVDKAVKGLTAVQTSAPVRSLRRTVDGVEIVDEDGQQHRRDVVVVATHPDQALRLLGDPTDDERSVLGAFEYSTNETLLHTDTAVLPRAENARASWNYLMSSCGAGRRSPNLAGRGESGAGRRSPNLAGRDADTQNVDRVQVTYWMNKLQQMDEPENYLVTLNSNSRIDQDTVLERMVYDHPLYTPTSVAAQRLLPSLNTGRTAFAGAYHGWGFHEDGCASGVRAAKSLGVDW
ncbi:MAG: FAD-dependent oxidoreductase, partial [Geodermatophilaceae bacterium]|nr:FAD-dependent oxidoreductase [Geodermatophilaceae bacterium]